MYKFAQCLNPDYVIALYDNSRFLETESLFYNSDTTYKTSRVFNQSHKNLEYLNNKIPNKSLLASLLKISRPTLYSWLSKECEPNKENIEWLRDFIEGLDKNVLKNLSLYKQRLLGSNRKPLEDLLFIEKAVHVSVWLNDSVKQTSARSKVFSKYKSDNSGYIPDIPESYSNNG